MNENIAPHLEGSVLFCYQCGKYNINFSKITQICACKTLLKYKGKINELVKEITDCKICSLIAQDNR